MLKDILQYEEKYGDIPESFDKRINILISKLKPKDIIKLGEAVERIRSTKKKKLSMIFYMVPKPSHRPRQGGIRKKVFYVKNASFNNEIFKEFIDSNDHIKKLHGVISTPCKIDMDFYLPTPLTANKIDKLLAELRLFYPISRPDIDNILKTYLDMIQKHLLLDDSLIIDSRVRKFYSIKPRIEITIEYLSEFYTIFNRKKVESWKVYKDMEDNNNAI